MSVRVDGFVAIERQPFAFASTLAVIIGTVTAAGGIDAVMCATGTDPPHPGCQSFLHRYFQGLLAR